ncbi:small multi-drug export protein [Candidatus Woesearchaeota archaeon]|nr:small multi-drug export protein [Candidatus Woesearchaeota archaeon]
MLFENALKVFASIPPEWQIFLITFLPLLELRASIPYGILVLNMGWLSVFIIAAVSNIILGIAVYFFLDKVIHIFLRIKRFNSIYSKYVEKTQKKIIPYVEKYGKAALAVFIGIPLPASGVYTGALAAYLLGMDFKKFMVANIFGVLIAAVIVTAVVLTGASAFSLFVKMV